MRHRDLTGRAAIHPAAFFQDTDPSLDADNHVGPGKWWVDTGSGNALKVRNNANSSWITVLGSGGQVTNAWYEINDIVDAIDWGPMDLADMAWHQVSYV